MSGNLNPDPETSSTPTGNSEDLFQKLVILYNQCNGGIVHEYLENIVGTIQSKINEQTIAILRNIARKYGIPVSLLVPFLNWICESKETDHIVVRKLCETLKFASRKISEQSDSQSLVGESLNNAVRVAFTALTKIQDIHSRSELTWALGYIVPHLCRTSGVKSILKNITGFSDINADAKEFLVQQLRQGNLERSLNSSSKDFEHLDKKIRDFHTLGFNHSRISTASATYIVQSQRALTTLSTSYQSEKTTLSIVNLIETLKSKSSLVEKSLNNVRAECEPRLQDAKSGSDRWWYRDTYNEVNRFLELARSKIQLKDDDLNTYLPNKLLGSHYYWPKMGWSDCNSSLDVKITEIFKICSVYQILNDHTIDTLFRCLSSYVTDKNNNFGFTAEQLSQLRYNAIQAIYSQSLQPGRELLGSPEEKISRKNKGMLSQFKSIVKINLPYYICRSKILNRQDILRNCLKKYSEHDSESLYHNKEIVDIAYKLVQKFATDKDLVTLFKIAIKKLETDNNLSDEKSLEYINDIQRVARDPATCQQCFTQAAKQQLVTVVIRPESSIETRLGCAEILRLYLSNLDSGLLTPYLVQKLLQVIPYLTRSSINSSSEKLPSIILAVVLLAVDRDGGNLFSNELVNLLTNLIGILEQKWSNYLIIALFSLIRRFPKEIRIPITHALIQKLSEGYRVIIDEGVVTFINEQQECRNGALGTYISWYVAAIILNRCKNYGLPQGLTLNVLLEVLSTSKDKQTRICVAEIINHSKEQFASSALLVCQNSVDEMFSKLYRLSHDSVPDVRIFCRQVFTFFSLAKYMFGYLNLERISQLAELFSYEGTNLDDNDEINLNVLKILQLHAKIKQRTPEDVFKVFDTVLTLGGNYTASVLQIICTIVENAFPLPRSTITALANVIDTENEITMRIFRQCIRNGQEVPVKAISQICNALLSDEDKDSRKEIFALLDKANDNQELIDEVFDTLEMERAGHIGSDPHSIEHAKNCLTFLLEMVRKTRYLTVTNFDYLLYFLRETQKDDILNLVMNILVMTIENNQPIPDPIFTSTITNIVQANMTKIQLASICKMFLVALRHNCRILQMKVLKFKLEDLLESIVAGGGNGQLCCDVFSICEQIIGLCDNEHFSDNSVLLLIQKIHYDEHCRIELIRFLPKLVTGSISSHVFSKARDLFMFLLVSTNNEVVISNSLKGVQVPPISVLLVEDDFEKLILLGVCSEDIEINMEILQILKMHESKLTQAQLISMKQIVNSNEGFDHSYYLKKLNTALQNSNFIEVQKCLKRVPEILQSDDSGTISKCFITLKKLCFQKKMVQFVSKQILSCLTEVLKGSNEEDDYGIQVVEILNSVVDDRLVNSSRHKEEDYFLKKADIQTLCEYHRNTIDLKYPYEKLMIKIRSAICQESKDLIDNILLLNAPRTAENLSKIADNLEKGVLIDKSSISKLIDEAFVLVNSTELAKEASPHSLQQRDIDLDAGDIMKYDELICILVIQDHINLTNFGSGDVLVRQLKTITEFCIKNKMSKSPMVLSSSNILSYKLILRGLCQKEFGDISSYFKLIPKLAELENCQPDKHDTKFRIAAFEYVLECCNYLDELLDSDLDLLRSFCPILKQGLADEHAVIRLLSFEGLSKIVKLKPYEDDARQELENWCEKKVKIFSDFAIDVTTEESYMDRSNLIRSICLTSTAFVKRSDWKMLTPAELRDKLLIFELYTRFCNVEKELSQLKFSTNFTNLTNGNLYAQRSKELSQILELVLVSIWKENILISHLPTILICLNEVVFETAKHIITMSGIFTTTKLCDAALSAIIQKKSEILLFEIFELFKSSELSFLVCYRIINSLIRVDSVHEFQSLLKFVASNQISLDDFETDFDRIFETPKELLRNLQCQFLIKNNRLTTNKEHQSKCFGVLMNLINSGFEFEDLLELLNFYKSANNFENETVSQSLFQLLCMLNQFDTGSKRYNPTQICRQIIDCLNKKPNPRSLKTWLQDANKVLVRELFGFENLDQSHQSNSSGQKTFDDVLEELKASNTDYIKNSECILELKKSVTSIRSLTLVRLPFNDLLSHSLTEPLTGAIRSCVDTHLSSWDESQFKTWAKQVKLNRENLFQTPGFIVEALAVIRNANSKVYKENLFKTQILSCLIAMEDDKDIMERTRGILQQVATGDGKSTIIRILAILQILKGRKVFVVTSNSVLAERDARNSKELFGMFDITVGHNQDRSNYISGGKECYKQDVIYVTSSQLQFDILRDEYSGLGTLSVAELDVAIVDEVDSMFIDDNSKFTKLASEIPGMDQLEFIYHFIWEKLNFMQGRIFFVGERKFLALGNLKLNTDNDSLTLEFFDGDDHSKIHSVSDIRDFISKGGDFTGICCEITEEIPEFIFNHLENSVKVLLSSENDAELTRMRIPKHLEKFVAQQIPRWVNNAMMALCYIENGHYIVENGTIKPVDFDTTGVIQSQTNWSDGLHQFLQIKHNLAITPEALATNFLSTVGFFGRFQKNRIFGFTGTYGSESARKYLSEVYEVDLVTIPHSHVKKFYKFPDLVTKSSKEWLTKIVDSVKLETEKGRAVLIICRTIGEAQMIHKVILDTCSLPANMIKLYTKNLKNEEQHVERVVAGEVIVATNLAGRGTDIKTTETIECNGGLHVCMTFLPPSMRAEHQAIGRTSRSGNFGTAQFILRDQSSVFNLGHDLSDNSVTNLRGIRDKDEELSLARFAKETLPNILLKDGLFKKFCKLLNRIRVRLDEEKSRWTKVKTWCGITIPTVFEKSLLSAVEEQWGFLIRDIESTGLDLDADCHEIFKEFEMKIDYIFGQTSKNWIHAIESPFYATCLGNDFIKADDSKNALTHFKHAINLDSNFSAGAHIGKAWCFVSGEWGFYGWNSKNEDYKYQAIVEMEKALKLLTNEKSYLISAYTLYINRINNSNNPNSSETETGLSNQIIQKLTILDNYMSSVCSGISTIKMSQRLVDIVYRPSVHFPLSTLGAEHKEIQRKQCKLVTRFTSRDYELDLTFNSLTSGMGDLVTSDQAKDFIGSLKPMQNYKIVLTETSCQQLRMLLNPLITYSRVSKEEALTVLEGRNPWGREINTVFSSRPVVSCVIYKAGHQEEELRNYADKIADSIKAFEEPSKFDLIVHNDIHSKFSSAKFAIKVLKLDKQTVLTFFSLSIEEDEERFKAEIEVHGSTESLSEFFNNTNFVGKKLTHRFLKEENVQKTKHEVFELEMLSSWRNMSSGQVSLSFVEWRNVFENSDSSAENLKFDLKLTSLQMPRLLGLIKHFENNVVLEVRPNRKAEANLIIQELHETKFEFAIKVSSLKFPEAYELLETKTIKEEDVGVCNSKLLSSIFIQGNEPAEVWGFTSRGLEYLLEFKEKAFIPVYSIGVVCSLGLIQIAAGGLLVSTVLGATVGLALITEGSVDLMWGARAVKTREFIWSTYAVQKSISLTISAASVGLGSLKNAGTGLKSLITCIGTETAEQGAQKVLIKFGNASLETLQSLATKQVGISVAEVAARECLFRATDAISDVVLNNLEDTICHSLTRELEIKSKQTSLLATLDRLKILHETLPGLDYQSLEKRVKVFVNEIVDPENNYWKEKFTTVGSMLCQGNAGRSGVLALVMPIFGSYEIQSMLDRICTKLIAKLEQYEKDSFSISRVIQSVFDIDRGDSDKIADLYKNLLDNQEEVNLFYDFASFNEISTRLKDTSVSIYEIESVTSDLTISLIINSKANFEKVILKSNKKIRDSRPTETNILTCHNQTAKYIVDTITEQIAISTKAKLVTPVASLAVVHLVRQVSNFVQNKYIVNHNESSEGYKRDMVRYESLMDRKLNNQILSPDEERFITHFKIGHSNLTVTNQIYQNAREFETVHNLRALASTTLPTDAGSASDNTTLILAEEIRSSGKKAGLIEIIHLSKTHNLPKIVITDDLSKVESLTESHKGRNILVYSYAMDSNAPFRLYDQTGKVVLMANERQNANCGYQILKHLSGKNEFVLRESMAKDFLKFDSLRDQMVGEQSLNEHRSMDHTRFSQGIDGSSSNSRLPNFTQLFHFGSHLRNYLPEIKRILSPILNSEENASEVGFSRNKPYQRASQRGETTRTRERPKNEKIKQKIKLIK